MRALNEAELGSNRTFDTGGLADQLERQRKKRRYAYPAWLCLGSHYLYLGRPVVQALFWLTAGGLLVWWLVDLFRIPALVDRHNRRTVDALFRDWQLGIERRLQDASAAVARHTYAPPPPAAAGLSPRRSRAVLPDRPPGERPRLAKHGQRNPREAREERAYPRNGGGGGGQRAVPLAPHHPRHP